GRRERISESYSIRPAFFFFSSRRRHTRFSRDWSSDVCSSDLGPGHGVGRTFCEGRDPAQVGGRVLPPERSREVDELAGGEAHAEIGRASCRERAEPPVPVECVGVKKARNETDARACLSTS